MDILTREMIVRAGQCDRFGRFSSDNMLILFQEIAGEHSERLGCGRGAVLKSGAVWVLTRTELEILRYPLYIEKITVSTFPTKVRRGIFPRFFYIDDENGERLINASSFWTVMDIKTLSMTRLEWLENVMPKNAEREKPMGFPSSAEIVDADERLITYSPKYSDLDLNGHVNNTKCAMWLSDLLGEDRLRNNPINSLVVNYNREIRGLEDITFSFRVSDSKVSLRCIRDGLSHIDVSAGFFTADKPNIHPLAAK